MSAIPPFDRSSTGSSSSINFPVLAQQLSHELSKFHDLIPPAPDQLGEFARTIQTLQEVSRSALPSVQNPSTLLMENIQDAATTAQTILNQPLDIPGATEGVSLLGAAKNFTESEGTQSDLGKIAQTFSQYLDLTASLKIELKEASNDLSLPK